MWRLLRWSLSFAHCNIVGLYEWWRPNLKESSAWSLFTSRARSLITEIVSGNSVSTMSNTDDRFPLRKSVDWVIDGWRNSSSAVVRRFLSNQSDLEHRSLMFYPLCLEIAAVKITVGYLSTMSSLQLNNTSIDTGWPLERSLPRSSGVARYHALHWMPEMRQKTAGRHTRWSIVA